MRAVWLIKGDRGPLPIGASPNAMSMTPGPRRGRGALCFDAAWASDVFAYAVTPSVRTPLRERRREGTEDLPEITVFLTRMAYRSCAPLPSATT
jgi:hypothetical protein